MKIRSLLLGSAAAMTAVTTANAADIIIPEPEVVEYVRVCDAAGEGYFFIPGSEVCLKIGGYVRYQIDIEERFTSESEEAEDENPFVDAGDFAADNTGGVRIYDFNPESEWGWEKNTRGQLEITAWSDTELGELIGFIALQGNSNDGANVVIDSAYIELGGLHMGYTDNAFDGGLVGEADILGGEKTNRIAYTFVAGSFDATLSLDDDDGGGDGGLPDFVPNVSGNIGGTFGIVDARLFAAYDNQTDEWAIKGRLGVDVGVDGRFEIAGYYTSGATYVLDGTTAFGIDPAIGFFAPGAYARAVPTWSEWSVQAAYQHQVTSALALTGNVGYWDNLGHLDAIVPGVDANLMNVGAVIDYEIVENFDMKVAVTHFVPLADAGDVLDTKTTGFVRFERSF